MLATVLILVLLSLPFIPTFTRYIVRYVFRSIGWHIKRKTLTRRELILARVRAEDQNHRSEASQAPKAEDEDWEQIEGYAVPTAPNGDIPDDDWEGIIGFFHPFAYVYISKCRFTMLTVSATLAVEVNGFSGEQFMRHRSVGPKQSAPYTAATTILAKTP